MTESHLKSKPSESRFGSGSEDSFSDPSDPVSESNSSSEVVSIIFANEGASSAKVVVTISVIEPTSAVVATISGKESISGSSGARIVLRSLLIPRRPDEY